jgi:hypothetical protein
MLLLLVYYFLQPWSSSSSSSSSIVCFRLVAVASWADPAFASLKLQLMALQGGPGRGSSSDGLLQSSCDLMLRENGDAAFGVQRSGVSSSGGGGISSGTSEADVFNNVIVISPIFLLHQGSAAASAALATFNAHPPSHFPRFFFVEKGREGENVQLALWGYVHASGMTLSLLLMCTSLGVRRTYVSWRLLAG